MRHLGRDGEASAKSFGPICQILGFFQSDEEPLRMDLASNASLGFGENIDCGCNVIGPNGREKSKPDPASHLGHAEPVAAPDPARSRAFWDFIAHLGGLVR